MTLTHLLVLLISVATAHAAPSKISLHNDSTLLEKIVVSNWTQLCEHLCSLNLSGPGCGLDCSTIPVDKNVEDFNINSSEHRDELCETLCENGLGVNKCDCKIPIVPSSERSSKSSMKSDKRKVCYDFCRFRRITLKGCSSCSPFLLRDSDHERSEKREENSGEIEFSNPNVAVAGAPLPPQRMPPQPPPFPNSHRFVQQSDFRATTDATTPDWNHLCVNLCRTGSGGLLCNCDLPPF